MRRILSALATAVAMLMSAGAAEAQFVNFGRGDQIIIDPNTNQPMRMLPRTDGGRRAGGVSPVPRETVAFSGRYAPGTIVINSSERRLYLVQAGGTAIRCSRRMVGSWRTLVPLARMNE